MKKPHDKQAQGRTDFEMNTASIHNLFKITLSPPRWPNG